MERARSSALRKGRYSNPGLYYLLTTATEGRQPCLADPRAASEVLDALAWLDEQERIGLVAAVVMPDHLHIVIELRQGDLDTVMHSLKSFTSNRINKLLGRSGQLWQKQYHDHAIRTEIELMEKIQYCLGNPVRAGLVQRYRDYPHWYCAFEV